MQVNTAIMVPGYLPTVTGREEYYIQQLLSRPEYMKDRHFTNLCAGQFQRLMNTEVLMTNACTSALEVAAMCLDIQPGDEVVIPSFTHVGTANAFAIKGALLKFVDIRPDTLNIDENKIEDAITDKTKVIVVMHYAGIGAEMETILEIAAKYDIPVVEDAAHCIMAKRNGKYLGTFGRFGAMSFDQTKNISCVKGGMLMVSRQEDLAPAEIYYKGGTDMVAFQRGEKPFYQWVDKGSNYNMDELCAAYLYGQMESAEAITSQRRELWYQYYANLSDLAAEGYIQLPHVPEGSELNGHIFYIKTEAKEERSRLIQHLKEREIESTFHYVPLHTSAYGKQATQFVGEDQFTTRESERLLRLPIFYGLQAETVDRVCEAVIKFYKH